MYKLSRREIVAKVLRLGGSVGGIVMGFIVKAHGTGRYGVLLDSGRFQEQLAGLLGCLLWVVLGVGVCLAITWIAFRLADRADGGWY